MQRSSETIGTIAAALAKAQAQLVNPEKSLIGIIRSDQANASERSFRYAPLSSGLDIVRKTLSHHEIATVQIRRMDCLGLAGSQPMPIVLRRLSERSWPRLQPIPQWDSRPRRKKNFLGHNALRLAAKSGADLESSTRACWRYPNRVGFETGITLDTLTTWWKKAGIDPNLAAGALWLKTHPLPTISKQTRIDGPLASSRDLTDAR